MTKYELAKKFRDNDYNCDEIHCSECQTIEPKFCNCTLIDLKTWADEILNNPLEVTDTVKEPTKHLHVFQFDNLDELNKALKKINEENVVNIVPFINYSSKTNYLVTVRSVEK